MEDARDIADQFLNLRRRVQASGLYSHEIPEFQVARTAHREAKHLLGVKDDLGSLTTPESRNLVRKVRLSDDSVAVLKIIGNVREPGEGDALKVWHDRSLPCVEPLAWGYKRVSVGGIERRSTATYLLTRYVEADSVVHLADHREEDVEALTSWIRQFHLTDDRPPVARTWSERLSLHLRQVVPLLRTHELREPERWEEKLQRLSSMGQALLHGDPAGSNVLKTKAGLVLLDPPGALVGLPEADVGQICWHVGGVDGVEGAVNSACAVDHSLNPDAVAAFAGFNLIVWAGYSLAEHYHPDREASTATAHGASSVRAAQRHLDAAGALLDAYDLYP